MRRFAMQSVTFHFALAALAVSASTQGERGAVAPRQTLVYTSLRPASLDLYQLAADGAPRRLTKHPSLDYNAALTTDGRWLVFTSERAGSADLWLLDLERGGAPRPLTARPSLEDAAALSPDGETLAFVSTRDGSAGIYTMPFQPTDPASREAGAVLLTPGEGSDFNPAFSPDGRRIAFSSNRGFERGEGSDVYVMAVDGSGLTRLTDDGGWSGSPAFSADGSTVYYHHATFKRFQVANAVVRGVPVSGGESTALTPEDGLAAWPAIDSDGHLMYATRRGERWHIVVHGRSDGGQAQVLRQGGDVDLRAPAVAAGKWIAQGPGPIAGPRFEGVMHPVGAAPFRVADAARTLQLETVARDPEPAPELQLLALRHPFASPDPSRRRWATSVMSLAVSALDGSDHRTLLEGTDPRGFSVWSPSWSPDGEWIAVARGPSFAPPDGAVDIWILRPDGTDARNLTAGSTANDGWPAFSPDGRKIVFRSGRDGNHEIYLMDADGGHPRRLTDHDGTDTMPSFSPTGAEIAFVSTRDGDYEVYTLKLGPGGEPGELRRITSSPGFDMHPHYSPDGRWLIVSTGRFGMNDERPFAFIPQPYGALVAIRLSDLHTERLTHGKWEDGMGIWVRETLDEMGGPQPPFVGGETVASRLR